MSSSTIDQQAGVWMGLMLLVICFVGMVAMTAPDAAGARRRCWDAVRSATLGTMQDSMRTRCTLPKGAEP